MHCLVSVNRYIIVVEHDLSVLDYLSDFICCLYGVPSAYGVVTMPFSVREGNCFVELLKNLSLQIFKLTPMFTSQMAASNRPNDMKTLNNCFFFSIRNQHFLGWLCSY